MENIYKVYNNKKEFIGEFNTFIKAKVKALEVLKNKDILFVSITNIITHAIDTFKK